jgi:phosphoglycolate phosphatase
MNSQKQKWDISCVIYDCDGVLFDSLDANRRLYNHICVSMGRAPITDSELAFCHMHTVFESLRHLFSHDAELESRATEFWKAVNLSDFISHLKMEPHVIPILDALRARGIATAISTNRTTTMKPIMERFNLWPHFDMVVCALDVERPKPDPEGVEKILAELPAERAKTLYVGDSEVDRKTARSAGVWFVAYKNSALSGEPDASITDHLALLDLLSDGILPEGPSSP